MSKCNNCKWVDYIYTPGVKFSRICPSVTRYNFEAYAAHGRMHLSKNLLEGKIDYSPTLLEIIYYVLFRATEGKGECAAFARNPY